MKIRASSILEHKKLASDGHFSGSSMLWCNATYDSINLRCLLSKVSELTQVLKMSKYQLTGLVSYFLLPDDLANYVESVSKFWSSEGLVGSNLKIISYRVTQIKICNFKWL